MKGEEGKWRQLKEIEGRNDMAIEEIEGRCRQMNGNEGIWTNMEAYEGK